MSHEETEGQKGDTFFQSQAKSPCLQTAQGSLMPHLFFSLTFISWDASWCLFTYLLNMKTIILLEILELCLNVLNKRLCINKSPEFNSRKSFARSRIKWPTPRESALGTSDWLFRLENNGLSRGGKPLSSFSSGHAPSLQTHSPGPWPLCGLALCFVFSRIEVFGIHTLTSIQTHLHPQNNNNESDFPVEFKVKV